MSKSMNRRMFLRGAGGAVMAIPFLPSLLSRAFASDPATGAVPKRFISVNTSMGEVWGQNMYPDDSVVVHPDGTHYARSNATRELLADFAVSVAVGSIHSQQQQHIIHIRIPIAIDITIITSSKPAQHGQQIIDANDTVTIPRAI